MRWSHVVRVSIGPVLLCGSPSCLLAQMPLLPVLQNGFVTAGTTVALDGGFSSGEGVLAAAGAFAPRSGDIAFSAGIGSDLGRGAALALGARAALPLRFFARRSAFGATAFVGVGGNTSSGGTGRLDVPVGVGVGYRHSIGASRGFSVYATPFYFFERRTPRDENAASDGSFRVGLGADLTVTPRIGLTIGADAGTRGQGRFGAGLSYLLRPPVR